MILITRRVCIHVKLSELKGGILKRGERDKTTSSNVSEKSHTS
jgi:hypothetical protein